MKLSLIQAPCEAVHPYFEISRFWDENPPNNYHFFILSENHSAILPVITARSAFPVPCLSHFLSSPCPDHQKMIKYIYYL